MSYPIFILDACTIINILHIDEDDFLFDILLKKHVYLAEEVVNEVRKNALVKFTLLDDYKISYDKDKIEEIQNKISYLIRFQVTNNEIIENCGSLYDEIKSFNNYHKANGEFISCCLSLIQSRENNCAVNFYTDDYPAIDKFLPFFNYQQIGFIQDSVDLILYLYWTTARFNLNQLKNFLSLLFYEYSIEVTTLINQLRIKKDCIQRLKKDKKMINLLNNLESSLVDLSFTDVNKIRNEIMLFKRSYPQLCNLLADFPKVFEVKKNVNDNLLKKIKITREWLNQFEMFKLS